MIGVGNDLLKMLRYIVNEFIVNMTLTEVTIRLSIPALRNIIAETTTKRDEWDASPEGKMRMTLKRSNADEEQLKTLEDYCKKTFVDVLMKTHEKVTEQLDKLKQIRSAKVKAPSSIETKMFKVLKTISVELSSYHGGSLNHDKDIKKVMNNATYVFDELLALIFEEGTRPDCLLTNDNINALCLHFREVFVLCDGTFSLARTIDPVEADIETYRTYVTAAVERHTALKCSVTPKVHSMLKHVVGQMKNIGGGAGR
jgi:hypothetical protein